MADVTSKRVDLSPALGLKIILLDSGAPGTFTGGVDTLTLTLADAGIGKVLAVEGFVHTTDLSVIVAESGTTAVATGVLSYTMAAGNNNKRRTVIVYGES
jgi:hypothetical protein